MTYIIFEQYCETYLLNTDTGETWQLSIARTWIPVTFEKTDKHRRAESAA